MAGEERLKRSVHPGRLSRFLRERVFELLESRLALVGERPYVYACGPQPMYASLKALLAQNKIPCQVLVEERMACGLGLCFGCVKKTLDNAEPYKRACIEGPVFDLWQLSL